MKRVYLFLSIVPIIWIIGGCDGGERREIELVKATKIDSGYEAIMASDRVNNIRSKIGLNRLITSQELEKSASLHAQYLIANHESSHFEIKGHKKFVGVSPLDRALYAGYISKYVSENLSTNTLTAVDSVDNLFSAIYHRFGFLSNKIDQIGVGVEQDSNSLKDVDFVYNMGNSNLVNLCKGVSMSGNGSYYNNVCKDSKFKISAKNYNEAINNLKKINPKVVIYPYRNQTGVKPVFYNEDPDPLPDYEVSGIPISVEFNDYYFKDIKVDSFKLFDDKNREVTTRFMDKNSDPNSRFNKYQFAIFPLNRLEYAKKYRAVIKYHTKKDKNKELSWSFNTIKPKGDLIIAKGEGESIELKANSSTVIYFRPKDAHDILKDLIFPSNIDVSFIDNNTIRVNLDDKSDSSFEIKAGNRKINVNLR